MSIRLLLLRHGQDVDNSRSIINGRRDTPLTDLGRSQSQTVADDLQGIDITCVYTSPLQRANQTASIIAERLGIQDLRVEPDLTERDYGVLTGRSVSEISTIAEELFVAHGFRYVLRAPGIEDYQQLWARAGRVLQKIETMHEGHTVLIVAHNEILKMIRAHSAERSWQEELLLPPISNCQLIDVPSDKRDNIDSKGNA